MTPDQRQTIVHARMDAYNHIMRTTIFTYLGIGAFLHLGPEGYSAPLLMLAIMATAYGVMAGGTALDDVNNLKDDMTDEMKATHYGKGVQARNVGMLKMLSSTLTGLTGLAIVLVILL